MTKIMLKSNNFPKGIDVSEYKLQLIDNPEHHINNIERWIEVTEL